MEKRSSLEPLNINGEYLNVPVTAKPPLIGVVLLRTETRMILNELLKDNVRKGIFICFFWQTFLNQRCDIPLSFRRL